MTDPRDRIITDPGIGPVDLDNGSTAPAPAATEEIEPDGSSLYYEPKPLVSVSDHKTLEVATVRLAEDIDPRKLNTELSLHRTPRLPPYDSGWPQAEVVLTSSQRPMPATRRWRIPAVLLISVAALLLLVIARGVARHSGSAKEDLASAEWRVQAAPHHAPVALARPLSSSPSPGAASALPNSRAASASPEQSASRALNAAPSPSLAPSQGAAPAPRAAPTLNAAPAPRAAPTLNAAPAPSAAPALKLAPPPSAAPGSSASATRSVAALSATPVLAPAPLPVPARVGNASNHGLTTPSPPTSSSSTESPSATKPKRAIY